MSTVQFAPLDQISTRWTQIRDPLRFVMRYSQAIRAYLTAILKDPDEAEEACQEFLARFLERGLDAASPDRGRFRDYLKVSVRNTALALVRRKHEVPVNPAHFAALAAQEGDSAWDSQWQQVVLDKAWRLVEVHEHGSPTSMYYTALRLAVDHPMEKSEWLAGQAAQQLGREVTAAAFRKQLSRARQFFARLVLEEVAQTLTDPTRDALEAELADLGLLPYVREQLPQPGAAVAHGASVNRSGS